MRTLRSIVLTLSALVSAVFIAVVPVKAESFVNVILSYDGTNFTRQVYGPEIDQIKSGIESESIGWVKETCNYVNFITNGAVTIDSTGVVPLVKSGIAAGNQNITIDLSNYTAEAVAASKMAALSAQNANAASAGNNRAAVQTALPDVQIEALTAIGINTKISECTTKYKESEDRAQNVRTAAGYLNGVILQPGQMLSYDVAILPRTVENGYGYGNVISGNSYVKAIGGGICQVSSTLNNAVLRAGIIPFERHNHSKLVHYLPSGLDATVSHGTYDYKFVNTLQYPIYIATSATGGVLTVAIYSNANATGGITYSTEVVGTNNRNTTYLVGKVGGVEVSRVQAYSSSYK